MSSLPMEVIEMSSARRWRRWCRSRSGSPWCSRCSRISGPAIPASRGGASASSSPTSATGSSCRCSRACLRIGLLVLGAGVVFNIHDADELIAFYDNGHGPLSELPLWLQAMLFLVASDFMLYWLHRMFHGGGVLEISRHPSFLGRSRVDLGGAVSSGQPVHRNDPGRRHPADGGHLAQHHALGRAVHDLPLRLRSRQPELDARARSNTCSPRRSSTAGITPRSKRAATPISRAPSRSGTSCSERSGCRRTGCPIITASDDQAIPTEIGGQLAYPFVTNHDLEGACRYAARKRIAIGRVRLEPIARRCAGLERVMSIDAATIYQVTAYGLGRIPAWVWLGVGVYALLSDQRQRASGRFRHLLADRRGPVDSRSRRPAARRRLFLQQAWRALDFVVLACAGPVMP